MSNNQLEMCKNDQYHRALDQGQRSSFRHGSPTEIYATISSISHPQEEASLCTHYASVEANGNSAQSSYSARLESKV